MSRPEIKLDEHGFPIQEKYRPDRDDKERSGVYRNGNPFQKSWVRGLVLLVVFLGIITMLFKDQFPEIVAQWYLQAAADDLQAGDLESALDNIEGVISWVPENPTGYFLRAELHREMGEFEIALEDLDRAIELQPNWLPPIASRAMVNQRLQRHHDSAVDYTRALQLAGENDEAMYRNNRAYARALGEFELEEGLTDAESAVAAKEKELTYDENNAFTRLDLGMYLDTRGLIHLHLGNEDQALADLNRALQLVESVQQQNPFEEFTVGSPEQLRRVAAAAEQIDQSRAVMYEHRAMVYDKQGKTDEAKQDHELARQLGFDPENGVF